jgi:glycolate oxidase
VELKKKLKTADSFQHWFNVRMQGMDGFRVEEDEGFCVVQSFFDGVQTYSSKGRLTLARGFLKGEVKYSSLLSDSIFSCTACGQCYDQYSMDTFEINNALLKARKELTSDGVPKQFENVLENIMVMGNPQGLETEDRIIWFEEQAEKYAIKENRIVYWVGCVTAYRLPEVVKSTVSVLEKLGLDFGILGENEGCCGLILYLSGQWRELEKNAVNVLETVGDVETLVTGCAGCYYMFSRIYKELGIGIPLRVLHISQLLDQALGERKLRSYKGRFLWHDPCDLGRHSGVYKPPRDVLHRIPELSLVEYPLTKEHAICCGAGGGLWMYKEELTDYVSQQKMIDTIPKGVDGVITGCPTCYLSMRNTGIAHRPELQILDLAEVVDKCL